MKSEVTNFCNNRNGLNNMKERVKLLKLQIKEYSLLEELKKSWLYKTKK